MGFSFKGGKKAKKGVFHWLVMVIMPIVGFFALIWFLIRVISKPSRAAYPCQRIAFPLASGFVIWILGIFGSVTAFKKAKWLLKQSRVKLALACMTIGIVLGIAAIANMPEKTLFADGYVAPPHDVYGVAKGVHPGRVVWVHRPDATNWNGYNWESLTHTDQTVVEDMVSQAVRSLAGETSDIAAWDAIFKNFNEAQGNGAIGFQPGEKIAIKLNLTNSNATYGGSNSSCYKLNSNSIDNSPHMVLSLLRQLVNVVGFQQSDISIGDPTARFPNFFYNYLKVEFPNVVYIDNLGECSGRTRVAFDYSAPLYWSVNWPPGYNIIQDYVPSYFTNADYVINFAILKGHAAGITVCAKNHYGSLIRTPNGVLWGTNYGKAYADPYYYDLHESLPHISPDLGRYRALVNLMGHPDLGGKTVLNLIDGLFAGYYAIATNHPKWQMAPFNNDWPSSLFASQDQVAIDSVAYDFLLEEWPVIVNGTTTNLRGGAEDYLHEAAKANAPASGWFYDPAHPGNVTRLESLGTHEHWNNPTDKQYSRNLGTGDGIELIKLPSIDTDFNLDNKVDFEDFALFALAWQSSFGDSSYNDVFDIAEPYDVIDEADLAALIEDQPS